MGEASNITSGPASPSATLVSAAGEPIVIADARGRKIGIRKFNLLQRLRLIEGLGEAADSTSYLNHALMIAAVASIDGSVEPIATKKEQIEGMATRLDTDGFDAVARAYQKHFGKNESGDPDEIKK